MKKHRFIIFVCTFCCMLLLAIPTFAAEVRASDQIKQSSMGVSASQGTLEIKFSITGKGTMTKIGCESIDVYEIIGTRLSLVESLTEDDSGMSGTNTFSYKNTIYCDGTAGTEYKVVVTVFAENTAGRDSRTETFYVTGK